MLRQGTMAWIGTTTRFGFVHEHPSEGQVKAWGRSAPGRNSRAPGLEQVGDFFLEPGTGSLDPVEPG